MTVLQEALEISIGMGTNEVGERQDIREAIKTILDFVDLKRRQGREYVAEEALDACDRLKDELGIPY